MFKVDDYLDTTQGILIVQCPITISPNKNPRYDKLGGKILYWMQNEQFEDVFLWDNELESILTEAQKMLALDNNEGDDLYE